MSFLATPFLWALPVALAPVIIYLIFRRRRRDVPWGPIYILRRVLETRSRARAWVQYLILALRTLALVALVLLFAQLTGPRPPLAPGQFPTPPPGTHRVVLLDTSASMAARGATGTRMEEALDLCRQLLRAGRRPGQLDLLPLDGRNTPLEFSNLPLTAARTEEALAACATPAGTADLARGLRAAIARFRASAYTQRELLLVSDFTRTTLTDSGELGELLAELRAMGVQVRARRCGAPRIANFAVLDCSPHSDLLLAQQPALFYVKVGFYGNVPDGQSVLTLTADAGTPAAKVLREEPLQMAPGEKTLTLPLSFPAGRHTLTATLRPDDLAADNTLTRSYDVRPALHVAIVQDLNDARGFDNPRTWLDLALANARDAAVATGAKVTSTAEAYAAATHDAANADFKAADAASKPFEVLLEGKIPEQLNPDLLRAMDLVIVAGVARLPPEAAAALLAFAQRGGTVFLAPAPTQTIADFNSSYAALAPAALAAPRYRDFDPERYEQANAESTLYPLLHELEAPDQGNLANPRYYNWFTLASGSLTRDSEVLLALTDGAPLLVERRVGRGGVWLWTAGLGQDWSSLVVHPAYQVLLLRFTQFAAARREFPRNLAPGEPLLLPTSVAQVRLLRPDGRSELVPTIAVGSQRVLRVDDTLLPGVYDVREDPESATPGTLFTVSNPSPESDLRPLTPAQEAQLTQALGTPLYEDTATLAQATAAGYPGRAFILPLALLLAAALILEAGLSRWVFA